MAKKNVSHSHDQHKEIGHWPYLAIVCIVAVVGVVFLVMSYSGSSESEISDELPFTVEVADEAGNIIGEAATGIYINGNRKNQCVDLEPLNNPYVAGTTLILNYYKKNGKWVLKYNDILPDMCYFYYDPNTGEDKLSHILYEFTCDSTGEKSVIKLYRNCVNGCEIKNGFGKCKAGGYTYITQALAYSIIDELES
ncbi:MAG: hypothetical protein ABIH82_04865 [Candidatus Woesearchaeota archaeon]